MRAFRLLLPVVLFSAAGAAAPVAGMAVIDVLTVEPNRIRWGNPLNGICDSDYSVQTLPWGRHGRYPDQLVPPSRSSDLVYGSSALEVVTYDASGRLIGQYGVFTPLPAAKP
jgi:hypothetical protein